MKRIFRWVAIAAAVLIAVLLTAPFWIDASRFKPQLEAELSKALGREVKLGALNLDLFGGSVKANDLSVADDPIFNRTPFVRANSVNLEIELWPLVFSHKLNVTGLTIDRPDIALVQAPSGDWNFSKLGGASSPEAREAAAGTPKGEAPKPESSKPIDLSIKLIKISEGRLTYSRTSSQQAPIVVDDVNVELKDFSNTSVFPFTLTMKAAGGDVKLNGKAGPIQKDVAMTPVEAALTASQINIGGSSLGLSGLISFEGTGASKGGLVEVTGKVKAEKLVLAKKGTPANSLVELDFGIHHDLRKQSGTVRQGDIHIGKAVAHLTGTYEREGDNTVLKMALSGPNMPVPELAAMLPSMGIVLPSGSSLDGGTATAHFDLLGPANLLVTSGSMSLDHTKLKAFDLGKKMAVIEKLAGIQASGDTEIQTMSANVRMAPDGMTAQDVKLVVPSIGELNGGGTISPANALDFKMTAAVHTGGLMASINDRPIPFLVEGTCADPVFRPDMRAVASQEVKQLEKKGAQSLIKGLLGGRKK